MKKRLFLTGPSGAGKSTIIKQALGPSLAYAGGLVTQRVHDGSGRLLGYDLMPAAAALSPAGYERWRFLDYSGEKPSKDNEVFRSHGVRLLQEAEYYPFVLLDEIGGFEMLIPQFRNALAELLNSELPIIGVVKGPENAGEIKRRFGLGDRFTALTDNLRSVLAKDADSILLEVRAPGDPVASRIARAWAEEYVSL